MRWIKVTCSSPAAYVARPGIAKMVKARIQLWPGCRRRQRRTGRRCDQQPHANDVPEDRDRTHPVHDGRKKFILDVPAIL